MNIKISVLVRADLATINGISKEELLDPNYNTYRFAILKNELVNESYNRTEIINKIKNKLDTYLVGDKRNSLFATDVEYALNTELENYKANPERYRHTKELIVISRFPK